MPTCKLPCRRLVDMRPPMPSDKLDWNPLAIDARRPKDHIGRVMIVARQKGQRGTEQLGRCIGKFEGPAARCQKRAFHGYPVGTENIRVRCREIKIERLRTIKCPSIIDPV